MPIPGTEKHVTASTTGNHVIGAKRGKMGSGCKGGKMEPVARAGLHVKTVFPPLNLGLYPKA